MRKVISQCRDGGEIDLADGVLRPQRLQGADAWVTIVHDFVPYELAPAPGGFAYAARCGACRLAARSRSGEACRIAAGAATGFIAAEMPALPRPVRNTAAVDGWRCMPADLIGAFSYTPLPLEKPPVWVEGGDAIPSDCDCVIDSDAVDLSGPVAQVLAEAIPGAGGSAKRRRYRAG